MSSAPDTLNRVRNAAGWRAVFVAALAVVYLIILLSLFSWWRKETALVTQVVTAEANLRLASSGSTGSAPALKAQLEAAEQRLSFLESQVPNSVSPGLFADVAVAAEQSGIKDFTYQQKGVFTEQMQAGTYVVYRFNVSGRGSQQQLVTFLDTLQKQIGPTMIIEGVVIASAAPDWTLSADILVYTLGV
jgi:Tfp pilus assembly protein PilO